MHKIFLVFIEQHVSSSILFCLFDGNYKPYLVLSSVLDIKKPIYICFVCSAVINLIWFYLVYGANVKHALVLMLSLYFGFPIFHLYQH